MEGVAEAAGVSKSTVYRHWPTKLSLLRDALEELNRQPHVEPGPGPARVRIEAGELPAHLDPGLAALALSGPIFYRRLMTATPLPAADIPSLMRQVLGPA